MRVTITTTTPTHTEHRTLEGDIETLARQEAARLGFPHADELDVSKPIAYGSAAWYTTNVTPRDVTMQIGLDETVVTLTGHFRTRGFERLTTEPDAQLPQRSTATSAGYDFFANQDVTISPGEIALVPTGVKAYMGEQEVLQLYDRSSNPRKMGLVLVNSVGIIDSDYYNNQDNEGHIFAQMMNITGCDVTISKGTRIVQGVFQTFLTTDDDNATGIRKGGFGSTN